MTVLPLVIRELRAEARRPLHFWLRAGAVAAATGLATVAAWEHLDSPARMGPAIFQLCVPMLILACWLVLPAVAADCLSVERREGTLGLLFLTPLTALDILAGKIALQAVRACAMVAATLPVAVVGFLLGGVSGNEAFVALLILGGSLALLISLTLLASASVRKLHHALLAAYGLAGATFGLLFLIMREIAEHRLLRSSSKLILLQTFCGFSGVLTVVYLLLALRAVKRAHREEPQSASARRLEKRLGRPVLFKRWFGRRQSRLLDRNPIAWLQQRGWGGRATKWGICLFVVLAETFVVLNDLGFALASQWFIGGIILATLSAAAVLSFAQERQSGALELLLVTPLRPAQIFYGRLIGLWLNFLPAALMLGVAWWFVRDAVWNQDELKILRPAVFVAAYLTIPVVGYAVTSRFPRFGVAWSFTLALMLALPLLAGWLGENWEALWPRPWSRPSPALRERFDWLIVLWLCACAAVAWVSVLRSLRQRSLRQRTFATRFA